ncbi:MAG: cupin domain-containing protein [Planctomycetaceae bacterium]
MHERTEPPAAPANLSRGNVFTPRAGSSDNDSPAAEQFDELLAGKEFRLERIVSTGQTTPPGEWCDQTDDEWVVLLSGSAALRFDDPGETIELAPGDWLFIPAHRRHRVERTATDAPSVWLALHSRRR